MKKVDAVVVGSGVAGSIAGAYLAKGGLKTVVFEREKGLGGGKFGIGTGIKKEGFAAHKPGEPYGWYFMDNPTDSMGWIEKTPTWYMGMNNGLGGWLKAAREVGAAIQWMAMPNTALHFLKEGKTVFTPYCSNGKAFLGVLDRLSAHPVPESTKMAVAKIWDEALMISADPEQLWSEETDRISFGEWLDKKTNDPMIKSIFGTLFAGYSDRPDALNDLSLATALHAMINGLMGGGTNYVAIMGEPGSTIPRAFRTVMEENGGQTLAGHPVRKVIVEDGVAKGVVVSTPDGTEETYEARHVVIATQYWAMPPLLGVHLPESIRQSIQAFDEIPNVSLSVHCALNRTVYNNGLFWGLYVMDEDKMAEGKGFQAIIAFPGHWEPGYAPPGKQFVMLAFFYPAEEFKKRPAEEWVKELINVADKAIPGFKDALEGYEYGIFPKMSGQINSSAPKVPMECPGISGLYFAGDYVWASRGWATERSAQSASDVSKKILSKEGGKML